MTSTVLTGSEEETAAEGRRLAEKLQANDVVLLAGALGAGKTAFVRGIAEGLGCDPSAVSSPTFTLIQEYRGRLPVRHVDLYRLTPPEADDLGLNELGEGAVLAVEWPDRWADPPAVAILVSIAVEGDERRRIDVSQPPGATYSTR